MCLPFKKLDNLIDLECDPPFPQFFLKDTKSSSGTFINHMRLSPPGQESVAHILKDGDVIQLGVDYQGGTEEMYRCVKIKVEVGQGREWQGGANAFKSVIRSRARRIIRRLTSVHS